MFIVNKDECVGCGGCISGYDGNKGCPLDAISLKGSVAEIDQEHCVGCGRCEKMCALGAIEEH